MTALTEVFVAVRPDMDKFGPEVKKKLKAIDAKKEGAQVATRFGVGMNGAMGSIVSRSAGIFAAGFAAIQGAKVFGSFINDARESAKISRITANAVKATGGAAKITADQVGELATAISNKTAIDDEQVQSAANMLLTFKNIRNETGKGNDVFNQATQAAADLSVQFGGIDGASKQLGKALNDPIKGTTALAKAGVTFTDQQKKQIATLVKSGDVLGAQKIILKEIEGQVGGAAAAAADPVEKLKVVAGNLAEEVGGFLLPAVNKFATFATGTLIPGVKGLFSAFQGEGVTSDGFVGFMEKVGVGARKVFDFFKAEVLPRLKEFGSFITGTVVPAVGDLADQLVTDLGPIVKDVFGFFKTEVQPRLQEFASFLKDKVVPPLQEFAEKVLLSKDFLVPFIATLATGVLVFQAVTLAIKAWAAVQAILNVVMTANPIGLIIVAVAALVAGVIYAYKHSDKFREIVQTAFKKIQEAAQVMAPLVKAAVDIVVGVFQLWWRIVKPILTGFWDALKFAWERAQEFSRVVSAGFDAIKEPAKAAIKYVVDKFLGFVENILTGAEKAFGWVPGLGDKLKTAAEEFRKFRDNVNNALNGIDDQTITVTAKLNAANIGNKNDNDRRLRNSYATGGSVFGAGTATSDSIPAMLSNGEHVWTAKEVQKAGGHSAVEGMRKSVMAFAKGGGVGVDLRSSNVGVFAASLAASARAIVRPAAQAIANEFGGLIGTMNFGRSQAGKPYVWGGSGPNGYDCSGFVSALINYAKGRNPYRRLGATGSMPWSDMTSGSGRFNVGWFKGNPGHTAATINGVNFESRGGRGVVVGAGARGASDGLFTNRAKVKGFAGGGRVGDLPYDLINPQGKAFQGKKFLQQIGIDNFDTGGIWKSGRLGVNLSGQDETVIPGTELELSNRSIERLADAIAQRPTLLDGRLVDSALSRTAVNGGY